MTVGFFSAAAVLAHASPNEIVVNSVISFLQLPDHVFEEEGENIRPNN